MAGNRSEKVGAAMPLPEDGTKIEVTTPAVEVPEVVTAPKGPFKVVATRPGYIYGERKSEGDIFEVKTSAELGSWMKLI